MGRRCSHLLSGAQSCSLVRGTEPRLEEVAVNGAGQEARDQSLVQATPKASSVAGAEAGRGGGQQRPFCASVSPSALSPGDPGDTPRDPSPGDPRRGLTIPIDVNLGEHCIGELLCGHGRVAAGVNGSDGLGGKK